MSNRREGTPGNWRAKLIRRAISIPTVAIAFVLLVGTAPLWIVGGWLADRVSTGPSSVLASFGFLTAYLFHELCGVLGSVAISVLALFDRGTGRDARWFERHFRLQQWWSAGLLRWAGRTFGMRLRLIGEADLARPAIVMPRHASIADTLIAGHFISQPHGIHLRHILKRELLVDPCLDIVGGRLPNYFVDRESDDPARELEGLRGLVHDLDGSEGVLIYPEGTRFTEAKRANVIEALERRGEAERAKRARDLEHVLPPRTGGAVALLQANPGLDVVFCVHIGFEGAGSLGGLLAGVLLDRTVDVAFWRVPFAEIPREAGAQAEWLYQNWKRMDAWVGERKAELAAA